MAVTRSDLLPTELAASHSPSSSQRAPKREAMSTSLVPLSLHLWAPSISSPTFAYSSFGHQRLGHSASAPKIGLAGDRRPDANRSVITRTGLVGRGAPVQPFTTGIPKHHCHKVWGEAESKDWRLRPGFGESPRYLRKIKQQLDAQQLHAAPWAGRHALQPLPPVAPTSAASTPRSPGQLPRTPVRMPFDYYRPMSREQRPGSVPRQARRPTTPGCCTYGIHVSFLDFGRAAGGSTSSRPGTRAGIATSTSMRSLPRSTTPSHHAAAPLAGLRQPQL